MLQITDPITDEALDIIQESNNIAFKTTAENAIAIITRGYFGHEVTRNDAIRLLEDSDYMHPVRVGTWRFFCW